MAKKRFLIKAFQVVLFCAFLFVLLEVVYRIFLFGWPSLSPKRMDSIQPIGSSGLVQASPFPDVIYELRPNLDTYFKLARLRTNSQGLRDREYDLAKPEGTFRIVVLGDSFTMPSGVRGEDAYHSLLEERLNARGDGVTYEVINFGVGGYSVQHYLAILRDKTLPYAPDLALVGFCAETDHRPGLSPEQLDGPYRPKPKKPALFYSFVYHQLEVLRGKGRPLAQGLGTEPIAISPGQESHMAKMFSQIADLGRQEGFAVLVAYLSNRVRDASTVRRLVDAEGMGFVDVSKSFEGKSLEDFIIYRVDGHPNEAAHQIFSDGIYEHLTEHSMLPASAP